MIFTLLLSFSPFCRIKKAGLPIKPGFELGPVG
jgi:hypothetical protein